MEKWPDEVDERSHTFEENPEIREEFENALAFFDYDKSEIETNPETEKIVSEGHEYLDIPRMRSFVLRANAIRRSLSSVEDGYVRLWRGNRPGEVGKNPSFTNSLEGIALPFLRVYGGKLSYVDVLEKDAQKYLDTVGGAPNSEFVLPDELAGKAVVVEEPKDPSVKTKALELFKRYVNEGGDPEDINAIRKWLATANFK